MFFQECMPPSRFRPRQRGFAVAFGDVAGFAEGRRRFFWCCLWGRRPVGRAVGGVDADDAVFADAVLFSGFWRCGRLS